eukprot:13106-Amphidinium_carterae.1
MMSFHPFWNMYTACCYAAAARGSSGTHGLVRLRCGEDLLRLPRSTLLQMIADLAKYAAGSENPTR